MDDTFEQQLANEGGNNSFRGTARDQLELAFLEQFALATDAAAKRDVVRRALLQGSPEALYYAALCDLLEVQQVLTRTVVSHDNSSHDTTDSNAYRNVTDVTAATQLLATKKTAIAQTVRDLESTHYCRTKAARVKQRLMLLELELHHQRTAIEAAGSDAQATITTTTSVRLYCVCHRVDCFACVLVCVS